MADPTPHNLDVEAALIASMMMDPSALQHAVPLSTSAFYSERYRRLFLACAKCYAKRGAVDPLLVRDELELSDELNLVGGIKELAKLTQPDGFTFGHAKHYVEILQREEARREAFMAAHDLAKIATEADAPAILAAFRDKAKRLEAGSPRQDLRRITMAEVAFGAVPPIPWIAEEWFGAGDSFVLAGEWGTGKSYLALDLAISLAAGIPWLGHVTITAAVPVLYLDEENNEVNARRRMGRMLRGREISPEVGATIPIHYLTMNHIKLNTPRGKGIIRRQIEETGAKVVVLDSFARFARKLKSSDNDALVEFHDEAITPLKSDFGVTVFSLDHMRKPHDSDDKADPAHRIQGGQEKSSFGDGVATFSRNRDESTGTLKASKVRWTESLPPMIATDFGTSEDESAVWITGKDAAIDAEIIVRDLLIEAGMEGLRATVLFKRSEARGTNYKTATRTVKRMTKRGSILRSEEGKRGVRYTLNGVTHGAV
jgi:hypothetical protein